MTPQIIVAATSLEAEQWGEMQPQLNTDAHGSSAFIRLHPRLQKPPYQFDECDP
jgi:hypothetical protein